MLIATFGPSTGWAGKTITREGDTFILEGHGPITAADVMEYDRPGHLVWADAGTRAWVGSLAQSPEATNAPAAQLEPDAPAQTTEQHGPGAPATHATPQGQSVAPVVATFNSSTIWAGKRITVERESLMLDGVGAIAPHSVLEFDRQGYLEWASQGSRDRVNLMAIAVPPSVVLRDVGRYTIFWQTLAALAVFFVAIVILVMIYASWLSSTLY